MVRMLIHSHSDSDFHFDIHISITDSNTNSLNWIHRMNSAPLRFDLLRLLLTARVKPASNALKHARSLRSGSLD